VNELIVDSFAGGGGASQGIEDAVGVPVDIAINHDEDAIIMHQANHPETKHYTEDVWKVNPREVTHGRPVGLLWASPDCKHFSRAKGGKPVEKKIRSLAWVVVKWADQSRPRVIILENVREFEEWGPLVPRWSCPECDWQGTEGQAKLLRPHGARFCPRCDGRGLEPQRNKRGDILLGEPLIHRRKRARSIQRVIDSKTRQPVLIPDPDRKGLTFRRFTGRLRGLGYKVEHRVLNAADFGAPTCRRRLFLIARRDGQPIVWPDPTHSDPKKIGKDLFSAQLKPWRTAAECIDWSIPCPSIFERKRPLAEATMRRIAMGIKRYVLDNPRPFIVGAGGPVYSGKPKSADEPMGAQTADEPMRTVMSDGLHAAVVYSFLVKYFGTAIGQAVDDPLHTVTGKDRFGVVTVQINGETYIIVDIGLRMLNPRELALGQGFPASYILTGTNTSQVARIGNSVPPPEVTAIVKANFQPIRKERAA